MEWPFSNALGAALAIAAGTLLTIAVFTTGLAPILLGGLLLAVLMYVVYVVIINIHRWATTISTRRRGRQ